ncbi:cell surface protein, partial [Vibrio vulnificus]
FKPGTNGSGYERGIYFAEMALAPTTGTVAVAGYPRAGASLSVIIMSDEESQYPTRDFDVNNNLFVDNGYRVYSIVDPNDARVSQYDDLSQTSLGLVLNINEKTEYKQFMTDIANNAGASTV